MDKGFLKINRRHNGFLFVCSVVFRENFGLVKLNLLFLLFCLPVITIPSSITAMTRIEVLMIEETPFSLWADFTSCLKKDFIASLKAGLIIAAAAAVTIYMFTIIYQGDLPAMFKYTIMALDILILALVVIFSSYVFVSVAMLDLPCRHALRNALILMTARLPVNLLAITASAVLYAACILLFPYSLPVVLLLLFSLTNLILAYNAFRGIKRFVAKP